MAGLYYYRARYYDSSVGRFLSEDPLGYAGGKNQYAYAASNPISFLDPSGLAYTTYLSVITPLITVNAGITLYGPGANEALAAKWRQAIADKWNQNPGYGNCKVNFNVQVSIDPVAQHWWQAASPGMPGANNYIYVPAGDPQAGQTGINLGGSTGTIASGTLLFTVEHEFGHLLGLWDNQIGPEGYALHWGDRNDIMSEGSVVTQTDIDHVVGNSANARCKCH